MGPELLDGRGPTCRLSLIHISEPTRLRRISYAVFCSSTGTTFRAMRSSADAPSEATDDDTDEARGLGRGGAPAGRVAAEAQVGSASAKPGGG